MNFDRLPFLFALAADGEDLPDQINGPFTGGNHLLQIPSRLALFPDFPFGQFGVTQTSPDGITWSTPNYNVSASGDLNGVTWFSNKFIAVGAGGLILSTP